MGIKIFVVDDEECVQTVFECALKNKNYEVTCANSFSDAITKFRGGCNIAFVDVFLGDGQGDELIEVLAKKSPDTNFCLMTGHPYKFDELRERYNALGVDIRILLKPIWMEQIVDIIQELLAKGPNAEVCNIARE